MALKDWLWLVRLIMEILKLIAALPEDELRMIASLRSQVDLPDLPDSGPAKTKKT